MTIRPDLRNIIFSTLQRAQSQKTQKSESSQSGADQTPNHIVNRFTRGEALLRDILKRENLNFEKVVGPLTTITFDTGEKSVEIVTNSNVPDEAPAENPSGNDGDVKNPEVEGDDTSKQNGGTPATNGTSGTTDGTNNNTNPAFEKIFNDKTLQAKIKEIYKDDLSAIKEKLESFYKELNALGLSDSEIKDLFQNAAMTATSGNLPSGKTPSQVFTGTIQSIIDAEKKAKETSDVPVVTSTNGNSVSEKQELTTKELKDLGLNDYSIKKATEIGLLTKVGPDKYSFDIQKAKAVLGLPSDSDKIKNISDFLNYIAKNGQQSINMDWNLNNEEQAQLKEYYTIVAGKKKNVFLNIEKMKEDGYSDLIPILQDWSNGEPEGISSDYFKLFPVMMICKDFLSAVAAEGKSGKELQDIAKVLYDLRMGNTKAEKGFEKLRKLGCNDFSWTRDDAGNINVSWKYGEGDKAQTFSLRIPYSSYLYDSDQELNMLIKGKDAPDNDKCEAYDEEKAFNKMFENEDVKKCMDMLKDIYGEEKIQEIVAKYKEYYHRLKAAGQYDKHIFSAFFRDLIYIYKNYGTSGYQYTKDELLKVIFKATEDWLKRLGA